MGTMFAAVYNRFLGKITDDMYMELTPYDTIKDLQNLLIDSLPGFEFPRQKLDYIISISLDKTEDNGGFEVSSPEGTSYIDNSYFLSELTSEEINILAILMMNAWLQRQVTTIEVIRMKYSGTDFKMTSQANHLGKLLTLQAEIQRQSTHMQRLYKRRRTTESGDIVSNWKIFGENTVIGGKVEPDIDTDGPTTHIIYDGGRI